MITLRGATESDGAALAAIDAVTQSAAVSPAPPRTAEDGFFRPGLVPEDVLVAELDQAVVGYAVVGQTIPLPSHSHVLELRGLAVDPRHQQQGIGRALVEAAVALATERGARKLCLRVLATNPSAERLYAALGFVVEGVLREEFLLDDAYVDDVLMARGLTGDT
jgi:ribosomal protein S18 acetylase RimI-like enzyme